MHKLRGGRMTDKLDKALDRVLNRFAAACDDKAFQGTIPRYESEASMAAWDAIDLELERSRAAVVRLFARARQEPKP